MKCKGPIFFARETVVFEKGAGEDTSPYKISASVGADVLIGPSSPVRWASVERAHDVRPYGVRGSIGAVRRTGMVRRPSPVRRVSVERAPTG